MGKNILQIPEASSSDGQDLMHIARNGEDYSIKTSLIAGIVTNDSTSGNWARGGVIYSGTGLVYNVWVNSCSINGVVYNSFVSGDVTLTAGDATNPRFDIFIVKVNTLSGTPVFTLLAEEGTPASSPLLPSISIVSEAQISFRLTAANETSDSDTTTDLIYDENVGNAGGEWNNTTNTTSGNLDYATDPYNGTKSFNTPATVSDSISWTKTSLKTFTPSDSLVFPLKSLLSIKSGLQIKLINSSNNEYFLKTIRYSEMESFGFIPGVSGWQLVQINLSEFDASITSNTQYDRIEYTFKNTPTIGLDWIHIQGGLEQPPNANKFTDLGDTPDSIEALKAVRGNAEGTDLEFYTPVDSTGLEAIDEGNGVGWRLIGRDPAHFGNVGLGAVDFSLAASPYTNPKGAIGQGDFAVGVSTQFTGTIGTGISRNFYSGWKHTINTGGVSGGLTQCIIAGNQNQIELNNGSLSSSLITGFFNTIKLSSASGGSAYLICGDSNTVNQRGNTMFVSGDGNTVGVVSSSQLSAATVTGKDNVLTVFNNSGIGGFVGGENNFSRSENEFSVGQFGTDYTALGTSADRILNIGNGTNTGNKSDALTILKNGNSTFGGTVATKGYTVTTLPTGSQGDMAFVTDATTPTYLGTLVGGGSVVVPVFHNGTNWVSN